MLLVLKFLGSDLDLKSGPHQTSNPSNSRVYSIRTKPAYLGKLALVIKLGVQILLPTVLTVFSFIQGST